MFLFPLFFCICSVLAVTITQPVSAQKINVSEEFTIKWKPEKSDPESSSIYIINLADSPSNRTILAQDCDVASGEQDVHWPTTFPILNTTYKLVFYDPYTDRFIGESSRFNLLQGSDTPSEQAPKQADPKPEEPSKGNGETKSPDNPKNISAKEVLVETVVPLVVVLVVLCSGLTFCFKRRHFCFKNRRRHRGLSQVPKDIEEAELTSDYGRIGTIPSADRIDTDGDVSLHWEVPVTSPLLGVGPPPPAFVSDLNADSEAGRSGRHSPPHGG